MTLDEWGAKIHKEINSFIFKAEETVSQWRPSAATKRSSREIRQPLTRPTPQTKKSPKVETMKAVGPRSRVLPVPQTQQDDTTQMQQQAGNRKLPCGLVVAQTAPCQTLTFTAPEDAATGKPVCVIGPHGDPLLLPLPPDVVPGKPCSIRLGLQSAFQVTVPNGVEPGDHVAFQSPEGATLQSVVPAGKVPGDMFEVSPPVLLVRVPANVEAEAEVAYETPDGNLAIVRIPAGYYPGHYFPVSPPGPQHLAAAASSAAPATATASAVPPSENPEAEAFLVPNSPQTPRMLGAAASTDLGSAAPELLGPPVLPRSPVPLVAPEAPVAPAWTAPAFSTPDTDSAVLSHEESSCEKQETKSESGNATMEGDPPDEGVLQELQEIREHEEVVHPSPSKAEESVDRPWTPNQEVDRHCTAAQQEEVVRPRTPSQEESAGEVLPAGARTPDESEAVEIAADAGAQSSCETGKLCGEEPCESVQQDDDEREREYVTGVLQQVKDTCVKESKESSPSGRWTVKI